MPSGINLQEFVAGFILESDEHLHLVNKNLVSVAEAVKTGRFEPRAVRELFGSIHTIKGLSSMVGAGAIADVAHEMESILRTADRAGGQMSEVALDLILRGTQVIENQIKNISKFGVSKVPKAPTSLMTEFHQFQKSDQPVAKIYSKGEFDLPTEILRSLSAGDFEQAVQGISTKRNLLLIDFEPSPENMAAGLNITSVRERLVKVAQIIKISPHSSVNAPTGIAFYLLILTDKDSHSIAQATGLLEPSVRIVNTNIIEASEPVQAEHSSNADSNLEVENHVANEEHFSVRVDIRKLDEVLERLSDLIVTKSKITNIVSKLTATGVDTRELNSVISENGRQLKRLRTAITEARMVSLSELLQRLPLVVRGLTKDTDKSVNIFIQAGSAEVDKAVADKIFPAIVHLIRNSVDHAIESKLERKKEGKDEAGAITVYCDDSSGATLTITIKDDGKGINREAVAKKCGQAVAKTDDELLKQICTPGISTREEATLISGRGMGMDIVKKTIEVLGGSITLKTTLGAGTTFTLRVPVSITIVDVLSFVSGDQVFVAPVSMIDEIVEVNEKQLPLSPSIVLSGPQPRLLNRRGETIPFLVLESILNNRPDRKIPTRALVVNQLNGAVAFGVDRMLGQQEVVVRPLSKNFVRTKGMNGAADLGDGMPTIVLDLVSLSTEFVTVSEVVL